MVDANRLGNIASTLAGPSASVGTLAQRAAQRAQQSSVPPNPGSQFGKENWLSTGQPTGRLG
jgi:hypothetical protein